MAADKHVQVTPARPRLSADRVRAVALQIVDADGLEALSMRRLAQAVDREPMTIYRYARNKAALLDGVVELVLSELHINPSATDWRKELSTLATNFRRLALAHPQLVPLLVTRPPATPLGLRPPGTLRPLEDFLQLLIGAGFARTDALHAYRLFFGFLHGIVLGELQELVTDPAETEDLLRLGLHRLPPEEFPQLRTLATELAGYDGATQLRQGVQMMILGLQAHFEPTQPST
jgi:AcrR family transcriptional regulator